MKTSAHIRKMIAVGVFVALAYICCVLFHFKVAFLSFELKDAVMTIGAMFFGPLAGIVTVLLVCLIEFITISSTGVYGLIMNLLSSMTFITVGSFIYKKKRSMTGAVLGMISATVSMVAVMMLANLLITPYYIGNGTTTADVAAMIPTLLFPFNLTKAIFNSAVVFLLYKPVSHALKASGFMKNGMAGVSAADGSAAVSPFRKTQSMLVMVVSLLVAAAAMAYFFLVLNGSFTLR